MQLALRHYATAGVAIVGSGLIAVAPITVPHHINSQELAVALTSGPSDEAFTIGGSTFDPGADGYNTFAPLVGLAPLLKIGGGLGFGTNPLPSQDLEVYDSSGAEVGTVYTSVNSLDLLGINGAQFLVQGVTPAVADVESALTNSDLDLTGVNVDDLATALTATGTFGPDIPFGSDITGSDVSSALFGSGITLPSDTTYADIAGVLNGMDLSDLPDAGTVYSIANLGGGFANVYEAVPNTDGTAAAKITDTLVTPFGNMNIPTTYDAVAHLDVGAAFSGLAVTADSSALSDNAFSIDGTTFDPGSAGFTSQWPLLGVAPLLNIGGGELNLGSTHIPLANPQALEVYNSDGTDLGNVGMATNTQDLLGIPSTQFTVYEYNLPESDVLTAVTNSGVDFTGAGTTAQDVADALGAVSLDSPPSQIQVLTAMNAADINLGYANDGTIADALSSAAADYTPPDTLPDLGTVYSVTNLGGGFENVYVATPNADGTAAGSITDTFITPFGSMNIPTTYDAIAPMDPGAAFAGLGIGSDATGLSDHAFTIDGTTFDPGSDGWTGIGPTTGIAPLLQIGGGSLSGIPLGSQDLEMYTNSGTDLGSVDTTVTTSNLLGFIETTQFSLGTITAADGVDATNLPTEGTVYSVTNFGGGFENVYEAIPGTGTDASPTITDTLITPWGPVDLSSMFGMFDAIAPLDPGDAASGVSDAAGSAVASGFDLFDPSTWF